MAEAGDGQISEISQQACIEGLLILMGINRDTARRVEMGTGTLGDEERPDILFYDWEFRQLCEIFQRIGTGEMTVDEVLQKYPQINEIL